MVYGGKVLGWIAWCPRESVPDATSTEPRRRYRPRTPRREKQPPISLCVQRSAAHCRQIQTDRKWRRLDVLEIFQRLFTVIISIFTMFTDQRCSVQVTVGLDKRVWGFKRRWARSPPWRAEFFLHCDLRKNGLYSLSVGHAGSKHKLCYSLRGLTIFHIFTF